MGIEIYKMFIPLIIIIILDVFRRFNRDTGFIEWYVTISESAIFVLYILIILQHFNSAAM